MPPITKENLENWFNHHPPTTDQHPKYEALRQKAKELAQMIIDMTPPSADQSAAIRKLREAIMTANASIACGGQ